MKKNLLVIDDSPLFLKILCDLLIDEFHVKTARSAEEAMTLLDSSDEETADKTVVFDLVITDLNMPGLNGFDVARYIRGKNREKKFTPVIMLTEMAMTDEEARMHGCAAYVPKSNLNKVKALAKILASK